MDIFKPVNRQKKFEKAAEGLSEEAKRELELTLLRPDSVPVYTGPLPRYKSNIDRRVARIVFKSNEDMATVGEFLKIAESFRGIKYITHIDLLVSFCTELKNDPQLRDRFADHISKSLSAVEEPQPDPEDMNQDWEDTLDFAAAGDNYDD